MEELGYDRNTWQFQLGGAEGVLAYHTALEKESKVSMAMNERVR